MSPFTISLAAFTCIVGGVLVGTRGHSLLPDDHRSPETKEVVRLGMAFVGTMVALVLGLLTSSAKGFIDTHNAEGVEIAANVVLLDRLFAHYGPEAQESRVLLRSIVARQVDRSHPNADLDKPNALNGDPLFDKIQELSPQNDHQRLLQTQALSLAIRIGQTRWLMFEQETSSSLPIPVLAMLVFWLTLLFTSFGLFVRPNVTIVTSLLISALAVSGAIFLILEMYSPGSGWIRATDAPLRAALTQLGQ
jgi:hypothetical protein